MKSFNNILYVAESSVAQAAEMARAVSLAENNQADLTIIDVMPLIHEGVGISLDGSISTKLQDKVLTQRRAELEALAAPYQQRVAIRVDVLVGKKFLEIIRFVLRNNHDLLIKAAENPDFIERLFGSNDMHLLRKCPCPVWLTGPAEKENYRCILAAVDFDLDQEDERQEQGLNQQILDLAVSLAFSDFAELHFVHVWDAPAEMLIKRWAGDSDAEGISYVNGERACHEKAFNRFRNQVMNRIGQVAYDHLSPQFHLRRGTPSTDIPEMAKHLQADLVVMGTIARTGMGGLFIGNTAENILEQLQCSVLAVKPGGFVSPVE